jgi:hypothetical protein
MATDLILSRFIQGKWKNVSSAYISGISVSILIRSMLLWPFAFVSIISIASNTYYATRTVISGIHQILA